MTLSRHFTLDEFLASDYAIRHGIDNTPTPEIEAALANTAQGMERVRAVLQQPIHINSGYRCPKLNSAIGGSKSSQHMKGEAADFICPEFGTPFQVAQEVAAHESEILFDQCILEYPPKGWVHVSFSENPRGQVMTIVKSGKFNGLVSGT